MSEDLTPRQPNPDDTPRLLALILSRLDAIESRLMGIEGNRDTVGKLDKLILEVSESREDIKELKVEVHRIDRRLAQMGMDLAETVVRVNEIEDRNRDAS